MHSYEPRAGHGLAHDPLTSIVAPRPIGWISTLGADGVANLAPYSYFNLVSSHPPIIAFASTGWKDSAENARATGEFVWNLATVPLLPAMNLSSAVVRADVDEFAFAGLAPAASDAVAAPRVAESPVAFECRVTQQLALVDADGASAGSWMTFGEVVRVHIDESLIVDGVYATAAARPLLRGGGLGDYFTIEDAGRLQLRRPVPPPELAR